jgi:hypothetical protein
LVAIAVDLQILNPIHAVRQCGGGGRQSIREYLGYSGDAVASDGDPDGGLLPVLQKHDAEGWDVDKKETGCFEA